MLAKHLIPAKQLIPTASCPSSLRIHSAAHPTASRRPRGLGVRAAASSTLEAAPMSSSAQGGEDSLLRALPDAHSHPQDDVDNHGAVPSIDCSAVAVMGTKEGDWEQVERLYKLAPNKVIPCFGVHPWFAHLHAASCSEANGSQAEAPQMLDVSPKQDPSTIGWLFELQPSKAWEPKLLDLLKRYPQAVVGEFGLDRAAVIPGTKVSVHIDHQIALVRRHLEIAAEFGRPVSLHTVRGYGHLQGLLAQMADQPLPPKIMLHSYGGSPDNVAQLVKGLPKGLGRRLFFSFSSAINAAPKRDSDSNREKLAARMKAVPDDRILIESDQCTPLAIDVGLANITRIMAQAKGWSLEKAVQVAKANFESFYEGFLPEGWKERHGQQAC